MSANEDTPASGWHRVSDEELAAMRPYLLNCANLSDDASAWVRREFREAMITAVRLLVERLGRPPTQGEVEHVRAAVVRQINEVAIPMIEKAEDRHSTPPKHGV